MVKQLLRRFQPSIIREARQRRAFSRFHRASSSLTLEQVFNKVYAGNLWGGEPGKFSSGNGSAASVTHRYCDAISNFVADHQVATVVDLGCGDFRVGQRINCPSITYIGIDIVASLIEQLNRTFGSETTAFRHLNIVEQIPPDGDLCLIRQVLQHLSNSEIEQVLHNVQKYAHVIITEHVPLFPKRVNLDKPHGPDTRLVKGSGVFLDKPPFSLKVETLLDVPVGRDEVIRTVLVRN